MRLVYFGSGAFGLPTFDHLLDAHDVRLVVSQPARPAGRRRRETPTPIAARAAEAGLQTITPPRVNHEDTIRRVRAVAADAWVVIAYGHKLSPELLGDTFAVNLHASLLPKYRGAAPINWAIIRGETTTGVSVITLARTMDAGAVLAQRALAIDPMETAGELHDRLALLGPSAVAGVLAGHESGTLTPVDQEDAAATAAPKLSKADGTVAFDQPARAVQCRVHGLTPWPGCTVAFGAHRLKLLRARAVPGADGAEPGAVRADGTIACADGAVQLLSVQAPGGKAMTFDAWRRGHRFADDARMVPV